ncbi:MAG: chemotaxis protein MotB [Rickettsiales bacterium]|nr:chemotaxis protein MotB [Rickettsiales bacterium]|tara:strand:+ start:144 stop:1064 length:921 start_codon:yes stop_codon:yes gene_type:complete
MSLEGEERPIFVKKIPPPPPPGHGGAWKVAYADFVTAMMAFFLLLWLLNATTADQKQGVSNYFEPSGALRGSSGSGGVFGGVSMSDPGVEQQPAETEEKTVGSESQVENQRKNQTRQIEAHDKTINATPAEIRKEQKDFEKAEDAIRQALFDLPQLSALKDSINAEITDQGLQIQLLDQKGASLFQSGSARLTRQAKKLIRLVATIVKSLPNEITISGHTDSSSFSGPNERTNWELSMERANSARRELQIHKIPDNRIESVVGLADKLPLLASVPKNSVNRRISIVLLRQKRKINEEKPPRPPRVL